VKREGKGERGEKEKEEGKEEGENVRIWGGRGGGGGDV